MKADPNRNPGAVIRHFTFTADPSVNGSYFWAYAGGVTYLDGTCQKTDQAGVLAASNRPGRTSVQFMSFLLRRSARLGTTRRARLQPHAQ